MAIGHATVCAVYVRRSHAHGAGLPEGALCTSLPSFPDRSASSLLPTRALDTYLSPTTPTPTPAVRRHQFLIQPQLSLVTSHCTATLKSERGGGGGRRGRGGESGIGRRREYRRAGRFSSSSLQRGIPITALSLSPAVVRAIEQRERWALDRCTGIVHCASPRNERYIRESRVGELRLREREENDF